MLVTLLLGDSQDYLGFFSFLICVDNTALPSHQAILGDR